MLPRIFLCPSGGFVQTNGVGAELGGGLLVGDEQEGLVGYPALQTGEQLAFGVAVERRGGLVEQKDAAGTQQTAGNGDALGLTFAEAAAELAAQGVETVGQLVDEFGHGGVEYAAKLVVGGVGLAEQEVLTDGAAEQGVALGHVDEVATGAGGCGDGALVVVERDAAFFGKEQGEHQADEGALAYTGLAQNGGETAGGEVVAEVVEHTLLTAGIGETEVTEADAQAAGELDGAALLLEGEVGELGDTLHGGEHMDELGQLLAEAYHGALNLRHELQEGGHQAEGDGALVETEHTPEEGDDIASREAYLHHAAREEAEVVAVEYLLLEVVLKTVETPGDMGGVLEGGHEGAVLQILLQVGLHAAVGAADLAGEAAHLVEVGFAEQQGHGHHKEQDAGQTEVEHAEEAEGGGKLQGGDKGGGHRAADGVGDGVDIVLETVEEVAAVELLASVPTALHQVGEEALAKLVAQTDLGGDTEQIVGSGEQEFAEQTAHEQQDIGRHAAGVTAGGNVDQNLAEPDEREGTDDVEQTGEAAEEDAQAAAVRDVP